MILGIGTDIADIRRIEQTLERFGDRFVQRVFTEVEQRRSDVRRDRAASYARRWAAKEACAKALGTGLRMGVAWREMAVANLKGGQPVMSLTGGAAVRLAAMTPQGCRAIIHVSMTDDHPYAQAFVVIEGVPASDPSQGF
jgi:holo-[acyl-carrier protein] synthase